MTESAITPRTLLPRAFVLLRVLVAGAALAGAVSAQTGSEPARVVPLPRDRYAAARPITIERFRSCFASFDLDGDGRITRREARGAAMSETRFREIDINGDGFITPDEFDLSYAREMVERGQKLDPALAARVAQLETAARARGWKPPEKKAPVGAPSESETLRIVPTPEDARSARARYKAPEVEAPPIAPPASKPASAPASRPAESRPAESRASTHMH